MSKQGKQVVEFCRALPDNHDVNVFVKCLNIYYEYNQNHILKDVHGVSLLYILKNVTWQRHHCINTSTDN